MLMQTGRSRVTVFASKINLSGSYFYATSELEDIGITLNMKFELSSRGGISNETKSKYLEGL